MKNTTTKFINHFVNALASGSLAYNVKYKISTGIKAVTARTMTNLIKW